MTKYLIIGRGRLATHFAHYLQLLKLPYNLWHRTSNQPLAPLAQEADRILLLISDSAILRFIHDNPFLKGKFLVHCSGSLHIADAHSAHPLNSFGPQLYDLPTYKQTSFIIEEGGPDFCELLPGLPNASFAISAEKRALYHALCVLCGNFSVMLWQLAMRNFEDQLDLPRDILFPYMRQTMSNLESNPHAALTGPLTRDDIDTIIRNLDALRSLPEQQIYYAFLNYHRELQKLFKPTVAHEHLQF